ncbi:MAG: glycine--tRNA ligase subunit beta [Porticoccaceae bacterium]|nr:glycine--tRNA ligase subunit beta [Porticoccaceae bacterium]|tara:strand:+ start:4395 stop:6470 length:2076 start_codon:yes stop_codon:yes gene_type:complete
MYDDLLIEIGLEELPAKNLEKLSLAFSNGVKTALKRNSVNFNNIEVFATPRRLAVVVQSLASKAADREIIIWGPPKHIAFDDACKPTQAAKAFAKKNDIKISQISELIENDGNQEKLCLRELRIGAYTPDLLEDLIRQVLFEIPLEKRMRWGYLREEFIRPVRWAVVLYGSKTLNIEIMGIISSNTTRGHRFLAPDTILISSVATYEEQLLNGFVIGRFGRRKEIIKEGADKLAQEIGGKAVLTDQLLNEVSALNEWPVPLIGSFDKDYLKIPHEILISVMQQHQKYFHVIGADGDLMPYFITVANLISKAPKQVSEGNERVIKSRLADAKFFYENDLNQTLQKWRKKLSNIVFQSEVGSLLQKTERVASLCKAFAVYTGANPSLAHRAGQLCKSDLVSDVVGEFDELQGVMGYYYALNDQEDPLVAKAISAYYLPKFSGDKIPTCPIAITLAIADRLDTLVAIFGVGLQPTGSKDPFALRRASLGLIRIIIEGGIDMELEKSIEVAANKLSLHGNNISKESKELVLTYILDRLNAYYKEKGFNPKSYKSVAALKLTNLYDIDLRTKAMEKFRLKADSVKLISANKRVNNILTKNVCNDTSINVNYFVTDKEKLLFHTIRKVKPTVNQKVNLRCYNDALEKLIPLHLPLDDFFENVMVISDDNLVRNNRLALMNELQELFLKVADISLMTS